MPTPLAASTPNKFELAKKFQMSGMHEGMVGRDQPQIDVLGLH